MKSYLLKAITLTGLLTVCVPAAIAGGVVIKQSPLYPNSYFHSYSSPSTVVIQNGRITHISGGTSYYHSYPVYPVYPAYPGYKSYKRHGHHGRKHHGNKRSKKLLPSTHIYGAYPTRKYYNRPRVNPHASSYQKKHSIGHGTYGYNHFSRKGNGSWYRY